MTQSNVLRIVVASPNDVQAELNALAKIIEELNQGIAADRGIVLILSRWGTDAYPDFHAGGPQGLIDKVLKIEDCDIFIGIFWKRFGTQATNAETGTEHEIETAYSAWKKRQRPHILVYFSQKPYRPTTSDEAEQLQKVIR